MNRTRRFLALLLIVPALSAAPLPAQTGLPDQFSLTAGEIGLEGRVQSLDRTKRSFVLRVTAALQPDGTPNALPRPVPRSVLLTGQTYFRARADASRQVSFADLKPGMLVDVAGTDLGVGRGLQAREVAAEGIGKAGRHPVAGGPPARIPSRTLFVTARSAAFLPDGQTLAVLDAAGNLSLWSTTALKQVASGPPPADGRNFVAVSLDGRMVARDARSSTAGGTGSVIRTYTVASSKLTEAGLLQGHEGDVLTGIFFHGSKLLATGGTDHTVRVWELGGTAGPRIFRAGGPVSQLDVSPDEKLLAAGTPDQVVVWNLATGAKLFTGDGSGPGLDFSPDSRSLATAASDGSIEIWSTTTWKRSRLLKPGTGRAYRVRFSPDARLIASAAATSPSVLLTSLSTGKTGDVILGASPWDFSRDGRYLFTSVGNALRLWSLPKR